MIKSLVRKSRWSSRRHRLNEFGYQIVEGGTEGSELIVVHPVLIPKQHEQDHDSEI